MLRDTYSLNGFLRMELVRTRRALDSYETVIAEHIAELDGYCQKLSSDRNTNGMRLQVNAERTVRQMNCELHELCALSPSLTQDDCKALFYERLALIKYTVSSAIDRFESATDPLKNINRVDWTEDDTEEYPNPPQASQLQQTTTKCDQMKIMAEQAIVDAQTHAKLAQDIDELRDIMLDIGTLVHEQGETVDSIEAHVESAQSNIKGGEKELRKTVKYKTAQYPLAAGLIGAAIAGGPIGIAAGSVWAAASAAVGGGLLGAFGGKMLRRKVNSDTEPAPVSTDT